MQQQRGAALVTVLLAITLLTVIVVEFAYSAKVEYHLARNALGAVQATALARSGVNLAMATLERDVQSASSVDGLHEAWAQALPPLPVGDGAVLVRISDAQGKFNLNALRNTNGTINSLWREVAERLFLLREIDPGLLDPLLDWLDADDIPAARGAERSHYSGVTLPVLPRNNLFLTLGELGRVEGFTSVIRARLDEVVTVLPAHTTLINVNTAAAELLKALFPEVDTHVLDRFIDSRRTKPVSGPTELRERLTLDAGLETMRLITTRSEFFTIQAGGAVVSVNQSLVVLVRRKGARVTPISWQALLAPAHERG